MNALALLLVALVAMPQDRALEMASHFEEAARITHQPVERLVAVAFYESTLRPGAVARDEHGVAIARGTMQLNIHSRWGKAWLRECKQAPDACELLNIRWGAWALRDAMQSCGSAVRAIGMYRTGRCVDGPRARRTVALSWALRWRLDHPSRRPLTVARLP